MPRVIEGRIITLANNRSVFVGCVEGEERTFIQFLNAGSQHILSLSPEGADALRQLLTGDGAGIRCCLEITGDRHLHPRWQVVREIDA